MQVQQSTLLKIWLLMVVAPCKTDYRDQSTHCGCSTQSHAQVCTALVDLACEWREVVSTKNKESYEEGWVTGGRRWSSQLKVKKIYQSQPPVWRWLKLGWNKMGGCIRLKTYRRCAESADYASARNERLSRCIESLRSTSAQCMTSSATFASSSFQNSIAPELFW